MRELTSCFFFFLFCTVHPFESGFAFSRNPGHFVNCLYLYKCIYRMKWMFDVKKKKRRKEKEQSQEIDIDIPLSQFIVYDDNTILYYNISIQSSSV